MTRQCLALLVLLAACAKSPKPQPTFTVASAPAPRASTAPSTAPAPPPAPREKAGRLQALALSPSGDRLAYVRSRQTDPFHGSPRTLFVLDARSLAVLRSAKLGDSGAGVEFVDDRLLLADDRLVDLDDPSKGEPTRVREPDQQDLALLRTAQGRLVDVSSKESGTSGNAHTLTVRIARLGAPDDKFVTAAIEGSPTVEGLVGETVLVQTTVHESTRMLRRLYLVDVAAKTMRRLPHELGIGASVKVLDGARFVLLLGGDAAPLLIEAPSGRVAKTLSLSGAKFPNATDYAPIASSTTCMALDPSREVLVTIGSHDPVRFYDIKAGRHLGTTNVPAKSGDDVLRFGRCSIQFTPDGKRVVAHTARGWAAVLDATTRAVVRVESRGVTSLAPGELRAIGNIEPWTSSSLSPDAARFVVTPVAHAPASTQPVIVDLATGAATPFEGAGNAIFLDRERFLLGEEVHSAVDGRKLEELP